MSRRARHVAVIATVLLFIAAAAIAAIFLGGQVSLGTRCAPGFTLVPGLSGAPPDCVKP
jgi:hypothetical protein